MVLDERWQPFRYMAEALRRGNGDEVKRCLETAQDDRNQLREIFAGNKDEISRAEFEVDLSILTDTFAMSGIIESDVKTGNAVVTALCHNLARYVVMATLTGSDPYLVLASIEERIRAETTRQLKVHADAG